jgi:hypothetical protein
MTWTFEQGISGVNGDSWSHFRPDLLIISHATPDTDAGRTLCNYTRCPRAYRDLPHFVLIDMTTKTDKRSYAFEFEIIRRRADRIIARSAA